MIKFKYEYALYSFVISIVLITSIIGNALMYVCSNDDLILQSSSESREPTIIIDAGHGGEDSGAVGVGGVIEKDLNLMLSFDIKNIISSFGVNVIMTREEDKLLYKPEENIKGQRKQFDLKNRYLIASNIENSVFVSIHMNKFPKEEYKGLQVYYSPNNLESRELAYNIQTSVIKYLENENTREIKNSKNDIYLLSRITSPAVLIECGFLSNPEDAQKLSDRNYRRALAFVISNSILEKIY